MKLYGHKLSRKGNSKSYRKEPDSHLSLDEVKNLRHYAFIVICTSILVMT